MANPDALTDLHEAKIKSITMEAPEGYEFGHVVKADVEMRVAQLSYKTNAEGEMIRTAVLVVEACHISDAYDPANGPATTSAVIGDPVDGDPVDVAEDDTEDDDPDLPEVDDDEVPF